MDKMISENFILDNIMWNKLKASFLNNKIPNAYIFQGNEGIGKEAHAIEYSALLNCKRPTNDGFACGECRSCYRVKSFNHEEISFISNALEAKDLDSVNRPCISLRWANLK